MYLSLYTAQRRSSVSTVLLARTWDKETVVELRKEAKARGLSTKGNKSSLMARIQEHEENIAPCSSPHKKTSQAASPGIPLASSGSPTPDFMAITLPSPSPHTPTRPAQAPYVPDFWHSAQSKPDVPSVPKVHVVSGSTTHCDGGPTHNLATYRECLPPASKEVGFWADFWESLGLPRSFRARRTLVEASNTENESHAHTRPLTGEERRGLYILLGIVGGSWLVGALVNRPTVA